MTSTGSDLAEESIFTWGAPPLKFGPGAVDEIGFEMAQHGARRVLILTDPRINALGIPARIAGSLARSGISSEIFDGCHVEPTDDSMDKAAGYAREQGPSESTAMCVLDVLSMRVKTGFGHWRLRPTLAVVDPLLSLTLPPEVTASAGMDIVCHALESYTARYYTTFERKQPEQRVTYCGSNPVSDLWCEKALALIASSFRAAVRDGADLQARSSMMLAATFAGMGFGNAGVHIPHANGYPIAGMVKDYRPPGYPQQEPMVPHGQSVSLTAPEAFRFTFPSSPERHLRAAAVLAPGSPALSDPAEQLPSAVIELMRDVGIPNGIGAVGYTEADIPDLVPGTMKQQRLLATCARPVTEEDIAGIFARSVQNW